VALPAYFQQTPFFLGVTGVSDVQQVIDAIKGVSGVALAGWTNPSGDIVRTPVNSVGQYIQVELTRGSATTLTSIMRDDLGVATVATSFVISGTVTVDIYFGVGYLYFEGTSGTNFNLFSLLALAPEAQNAHRAYAFAMSNNSNTQTGCAFNLSTGAYDAVFAGFGRIQQFVAREYAAAQPAICQTPSGYRRWYPMIICCVNGANTFMVMAGRVPNFILINGGIVNPGDRFVIPIDEATTAEFVVLKIASAGTTVTNPPARIACRVP